MGLKMQLKIWRKAVRRKPLALLVLFIIFVLAFITVVRLAGTSNSNYETRPSSRVERSTSPVELSWPLPLTGEETSPKVPFGPLKKKLGPVSAEELKKLHDVFPK